MGRRCRPLHPVRRLHRGRLRRGHPRRTGHRRTGLRSRNGRPRTRRRTSLPDLRRAVARLGNPLRRSRRRFPGRPLRRPARRRSPKVRVRRPVRRSPHSARSPCAASRRYAARSLVRLRQRRNRRLPRRTRAPGTRAREIRAPGTRAGHRPELRQHSRRRAAISPARRGPPTRRRVRVARPRRGSAASKGPRRAVLRRRRRRRPTCPESAPVSASPGRRQAADPPLRGRRRVASLPPASLPQLRIRHRRPVRS